MVRAAHGRKEGVVDGIIAGVAPTGWRQLRVGIIGKVTCSGCECAHNRRTTRTASVGAGWVGVCA